jgi:hypothetical protein
MTPKEYSVRRALVEPDAKTLVSNMADAVSYLCTVAAEAGLDGIAARLTRVRSSLQRMAASGDENPAPQPKE